MDSILVITLVVLWTVGAVIAQYTRIGQIRGLHGDLLTVFWPLASWLVVVYFIAGWRARHQRDFRDRRSA